MAHASFRFLLAATNASVLISTIQIFNIAPMTGGKPTANRKPQMCFSPPNSHPGAILTELSRHMTDDEFRAYGLSRTDSFGSIPAGKSVAEGGDFKTIEQGAATGPRRREFRCVRRGDRC